MVTYVCDVSVLYVLLQCFPLKCPILIHMPGPKLLHFAVSPFSLLLSLGLSLRTRSAQLQEGQIH